MKKRRRKSTPRVIRITPEANAYLNFRAEQLGLSGAEYSRRMMFLECWEGLVFDDVRAIEAAAAAEAEARQGLPVEAYLPYKQTIIARLRQGEQEVNQLEAFVLECVLPALKEARAKIAAALHDTEERARTFVGLVEIQKLTRKVSGREDS